MFLADTYACPILGPLVPLFWISGDFKVRIGSPLFAFAEANVMYIPCEV